ncbi:hypothetical protein LEP1GSC186_2748 [Leptospira noguchii serovar Autumnalis str. ZUN142]|uniref:Uncharacterized protein n=1 Tax=Leptospira noguchii serovar Autumnalis str. ZUN142 TaxID=1085540 RepID=M6U2R0_9LEPT|nr:hypothetical protein LEP1GSC186_2748 [Leptospira noguchii serovar Autumnalis str. ZUN142]
MGTITNHGIYELNSENCGNYYKKNHRPIRFCTKSLFCGHHQNLNSI